MGDNGIVGLIMQLGADTAGADEAIEQFAKRTGQSVGMVEAQMRDYRRAESAAYDEAVQRSRGAADELDKSLLNSHQSVHLLAEEMGIHLPRAVVGGIAEMLPAVGSLGSALLAVFAAKEIVEFAGHLHKLADDYNGVADAQKALNAAGQENASILEEQAKQSSAYARAQLTLLIVQAAQAEAATDQTRKNQDVLPAWEKAILQASLAVSTLGTSLAFTSKTNELLGVAQRYYLGQSKELTEAIGKQTAAEKLRDDVLNILGADEVKEAKARKKSSDEAAAVAWELLGAGVSGLAGAGAGALGGGRSADYGRSGGSSASGRDSSGGRLPDSSALAAGSGGRFGGTANVVVFGTNQELQHWVAGAVNGAVQRGITVNATSAQKRLTCRPLRQRNLESVLGFE